MELRAMSIAREAGVPVAGCLQPPGDATALFGTCARAPRGEPCDWAVFNFVQHVPERKVRGRPDDILTRTMAQLHSLDLSNVDTAPLARFESWREHIAYLAELAAESGCADSGRAVEATRGMLEASGAPDLAPALCHLDWHLGNVLCDAEGNVKALIDWEFAGVGDPRIDLARFCRRERWTGDCVCRDKGSDRDTQKTWEAYAAARWGDSEAAALLLGPPEPWLALESTLVLVIGRALCARAARLQRHGAGEVPRCGLEEWAEDAETAAWHLRRMTLL